MPSTGTQLASVVLLGFAIVVGIIATLDNQWATEHRTRDALDQQSDGHYFGLWKRCEHHPTGASYCDHYDDYLLGSSIELVGARAAMLLGIVLLSISICMMSCAVDCATLVDSARGRKKMRLVCGILVTLAGIFMVLAGVMMAVVIGKHYHSQMYYMEARSSSRYGRDVTEEEPVLETEPDLAPEPKLKGQRLGNLSTEMGNKTMNIGQGVFLAITSGILSLVAGGMMLCQSCGQSDDDEFYDGQYSQATERIVNNKRQNEYL